MFFTEKILHEFYFDLPDKMLFFTGQLFHSPNFRLKNAFTVSTSNILIGTGHERKRERK